MAQLNLVVGDLSANAARIIETLAQAEERGADLCLFPELAVPGYPPEDLLMKPRFLADNVAAVRQVAAATRRTVAVLGYVEPEDEASAASQRTGDGGGSRPPTRLWNAAAVCANGSIVGSYRKHVLPNYGVFDEKRWFSPGTGSHVLYDVAGVAVGVSICEDVWSGRRPGGRAWSRWRRPCREHQRVALLPRPVGRAPGDAARARSARRAVRSPTATSSAARTSSSSTERAWSLARTAPCSRRPTVRRGPDRGRRRRRARPTGPASGRFPSSR